jgi:hypothetical protein
MALYIAHESNNFGWEQTELERFRELWKTGASFEDIAKKLRRKQMDVILLILDQYEQGKLEARKGGVYGWKD